MTSMTISISTQFPKLIPTITIPYKSHHPYIPLTFSRLQNSHHFRICCTPHSSSPPPPPPPPSCFHYPGDIPALLSKTLIIITFSLALLFLRVTSNLLLPDFHDRWNDLIAFSSQAEVKLLDGYYPPHLLQAVVAYEDRRFFRHFGVDPVGIARAVLSLSKRGGGSTITQQLVKNVLLKNECTFLRKIVEVVLALALERNISKLRILSTYLSKIYWGHGIYGVEMASSFYFGKHPSLLNLGECAMLVGLIPAPELRSPFRNPGRGKIFQARVLRRMVEVGFLDVKTALHVVKQPLCFNTHWPDHADGISPTLSKQVPSVFTTLERDAYSDVKSIWEWKGESKIREVEEDMERWAMKLSGGCKLNLLTQRKKKMKRQITSITCSE